MSTRKQQVYARVAWLYDFLDAPFEHGRYQPLRRAVFDDTAGQMLDAGVGTGRNMPFYPEGAEMTAIDLSPHMLARAERRQARLGVQVDLKQMNVTATDFADARFDHVIATFLFCVLDPEHQLPALKELKRICKPDGEIRILEYEYSRNPWRRFVMKLWAPWVKFMYGASFDRHTEQYAEAAGLRVVEERFLYEDIVKLLVLKP